MTRRSDSFVLWFLSAGFCVMCFHKGHGAPLQGVPVAFMHNAGSSISLRIMGAVPKPGVYQFPKGVTVRDVIKMTLLRPSAIQLEDPVHSRKMKTGDIVTVRLAANEHADISVGSMTARERMLLGIPLNPDLMDCADWDALPGIGPELAKSIIAERHKNGGFGTVEHLERVPGLGSKRIESIRRYF